MQFRPSAATRTNKLLLITHPQESEIPENGQEGHQEAVQTIRDTIKYLSENRPDFLIGITVFYSHTTHPILEEGVDRFRQVTGTIMKKDEFATALQNILDKVDVFATSDQDAFENPLLRQWIRHRGIDEIYFGGFQSGDCLYISAVEYPDGTPRKGHLTRFLLPELSDYLAGTKEYMDMYAKGGVTSVKAEFLQSKSAPAILRLGAGMNTARLLDPA